MPSSRHGHGAKATSSVALLPAAPLLPDLLLAGNHPVNPRPRRKAAAHLSRAADHCSARRTRTRATPSLSAWRCSPPRCAFLSASAATSGAARPACSKHQARGAGAPSSAMASSTAPASHAAPLPGPPPTPTSLMNLPAPWRLQLATSSAFDGHRDTLEALFSTCTFFRDTLLRHRTTVATFSVPLTPGRFPAELEKLCTIARRSSRVRLQFEGEWVGYDKDERPAAGWMQTEPHVTHLLVCAMAQLGGEQPLACIMEIRLNGLEHTALVPAWVRVLCPNVAKLDFSGSIFPLHSAPPSLPHPHLQHLGCNWRADNPLTAEHIRKQLSALPSLSSLNLRDMDWAAEEDEQQAMRLISSTVTRLELTEDANEKQPEAVERLPTQFPCLRELDADFWLDVDDAGLEALLSMPHLESFTVYSFSLAHSHTHRTWRVPQMTARELDVESFACLPLESIPACSGLWWVHPSTDAAAVARVADAVKRWGGLAPAWRICGSDVAALLATLGPLVAALPATQQQWVRIDGLQATSAQVQQLDQRLPASITHLELMNCDLTSDAWPALLPSLPATVVEVRFSLMTDRMVEEHLVAMCQAAVRPIKVQVPRTFDRGFSEQDLDRITRSLVLHPGGSGEQQQQPGSLVTLVCGWSACPCSSERVGGAFRNV